MSGPTTPDVRGALQLSARTAQLDDPIVQARNLSFFL
jgi:hypothetical protein